MFPTFDCTTNNGRTSAAITTNNHNRRIKDDGGGRRVNFSRYLLPFTRFWGISTAIVLGGVGIDFLYHNRSTGYYLIGEALLVLILEALWVVTAFLQICLRAESRFWQCWSVVHWLEGWKKSLLYSPMMAIPLLWANNLWLCYVAASQLGVLSSLHLIVSFKGRRRRRRKDRLLNGDLDSFESSKFEEVTEVLDDALPEPIPGSSHSLSDSLAEQDTILEI